MNREKLQKEKFQDKCNTSESNERDEATGDRVQCLLYSIRVSKLVFRIVGMNFNFTHARLYSRDGLEYKFTEPLTVHWLTGKGKNHKVASRHLFVFSPFNF